MEDDAQRLARAITQFGRSEGYQFDLCLDSPGGSFQEALKIITFLTKGDGRGVATIIEAGGECLSACALIFMAGSLQGAHGLYPLHHLHAKGRLGFHAPFLSKASLPKGPYSKETVLAAYQSALKTAQGIIAVLGGRGSVEYAVENRPWMKLSLIELMLAKGEDELFEIDTVDKVGRWSIGLYGYTLPRRVDAQTAAVACWNAFGWQKDEYSAYPTFSHESNVKHSLDGGTDVFTMMVSDGDRCEIRNGSVSIGGRAVSDPGQSVIFFTPETRIRELAAPASLGSSKHKIIGAKAPRGACVVADPSGTPLNVRSIPGGTIIGTLQNGERVSIGEVTTDTRGRVWARIGIGWVFKDYLDCG